MATVYFSQSLSVCSAEAVPPLLSRAQRITDLTVTLFKYHGCMYPICALCGLLVISGVFLKNESGDDVPWRDAGLHRTWRASWHFPETVRLPGLESFP